MWTWRRIEFSGRRNLHPSENEAELIYHVRKQFVFLDNGHTLSTERLSITHLPHTVISKLSCLHETPGMSLFDEARYENLLLADPHTFHVC